MTHEINSTGRGSDKFMLRFPDGMRERIALDAKLNNRTMNAEIIARLRATYYDAGSSETRGRLVVALTTLRLLHRLVEDADLKKDIGILLEFMGDDESKADVGMAALALKNLNQRSLGDKTKL